MRLVVAPMELEDIPQVLEVDRESYSLPWPASAYRREILHNRNARYVVLREQGENEAAPSPERADTRPRLPFPFLRWPHRSGDSADTRPGQTIGYAGMWLMVDEAHITTIAVRSEWRSRGLGELLLVSLIEDASDVGAHRVTLEVRVSNEIAQNLYGKYGFRREGVRPRYYSDNNEDAFIMTTDDIRNPTFRSNFQAHRQVLRERLTRSGEFEIVTPAGRSSRSSVAGGAEHG